jgi:hypothetical protein
MYYCKQRYYVPSWGRWLNGDNLSNINFSDIKNLNLYLYCANNPIIYYDPNGDIVVSALVIGTIVGCAIGVVSSILYQGFTTKWQKINPYQVILDGLMGGICGLIGASGLNAIASALISGGLGFTNSVLGDLIESDGNTKEIDWLKASFMGVLNCFLSYKLCGAGSQNINDLGELLIKNSEVNKTFTIIANASDSYEAGLMSTRGFQGVLNLYSGQLSYAINNALTNIIYKKTIKGLMMFSVSTICAETGLFGYEFIKCIFNKKRW